MVVGEIQGDLVWLINILYRKMGETIKFAIKKRGSIDPSTMQNIWLDRLPVHV